MSDKEQHNNDNTIHCSFCGRSSHEVNSMVAGPDDVYICDRCVADASGIVKSDLASMSKKREKKIPAAAKAGGNKSQAG